MKKYSKKELKKREELQLKIDNLDKNLLLKLQNTKDYGYYNIYLPIYNRYFRISHYRLRLITKVNDYTTYSFVQSMYDIWVTTYNYNTDIPNNKGVNIRISAFDYKKEWVFKDDWNKILLGENRIKKLERILEE